MLIHIFINLVNYVFIDSSNEFRPCKGGGFIFFSRYRNAQVTSGYVSRLLAGARHYRHYYNKNTRVRVASVARHCQDCGVS